MSIYLEFILNGPKIDENDEFLSVVFKWTIRYYGI